MKKLLFTLIVLGLAGAGAWYYYDYRNAPVPPTIATAVVTSGDIIDAIGATGTLEAVTTVQVGSQVSGTISELYADYNSLVRRGQVIARLDPSLFETQIEQSRANLIRAEADHERLKVSLEDAQTKLRRARDLAVRNLIPQSELETAEVTVRSTEAQIRSSEAQVTQAQASLNQNEVNLQHTVITAPIDGLVISRSVDVGQTVAASMQAPVLFLLAADLAEMQVIANLDESDVGRIRPGQRVTFRVDAFPADEFTGSVTQVRLEPIVEQNVVTYATVIRVPNPELKLKPGMTATVSVEVARSDGATGVPNAALRFRPTEETYLALGLTSPDAASAATADDGASPAAAPSNGEGFAGAPSDGGGGGGFGGGGFGGGRGGDFAARMESMSPEEREAIFERMRGRGIDPSSFGRGGGGRRGGGRAPGAAGATTPSQPLTQRNPQATTIDALFAPLPRPESTGRVWRLVDGQLQSTTVRLGITDGRVTELLDGDLPPGTPLLTNVTSAAEEAAAAAASGNSNPFGGFRGGRGFPF